MQRTADQDAALNRRAAAERAAIIISTSFDTAGLLVCSRIADCALVQSLRGGMVVVIWRKLDKSPESVRAEQLLPSWAEWFQSLAEPSAGYKDEARPACIAHREWKP